jgi:hypothetical protein
MDTLALIVDAQRSLAEEIRDQRKDAKILSEALNQTVVELARLTGRVEQVHRDLSNLSSIYDRLTEIESAYDSLTTKISVWATVAGAVGALVVTGAVTVARILFG